MIRLQLESKGPKQANRKHTNIEGAEENVNKKDDLRGIRCGIHKTRWQLLKGQNFSELNIV